MTRPDTARIGPAPARQRPRRLDPEAVSPMRGGYAPITLTLVALVSMIAFEAMSVTVVMTPVASLLGAPALYGLAFSLMFTAQMLGTVVSSPWVNRRGPIQVVMVGQALFVLGSLVAGLATSFWMLLAGRVLAGLGAGLSVVAEYVIIGRVFPARLRPQVFSWTSAAWVLPSIIGPLIAGWLMETWSWRLVFLIVVPATLVTMAGFVTQRLAVPYVSPTPHPEDGTTVRYGLGLAAGAAAFQWGASHLTPPSTWATALTVAGLVLLGATVPRLVPAGTVRMRPGLPSVILVRFLILAAFNGAVTFVPTLLISQRSLSVTAAGMILALTSIGWAAGSVVQGRRRYLGRAGELVTAGALCATGGLLGCAAIAATGGSVALFVPVVGVVGVGMGLISAATSTLTLTLAPARRHASASSALQLSDVLGSAIGISVTGAIYAALLPAQAGVASPSVFVLMWLLTSAVAALAWPAARRTQI